MAFGDIVKVTPSSKVVGDMAIFLVNHDMTMRAVRAASRPDHNLTLPNSVIEMFMGSLGEPEGGWPKKLQNIILRGAKPQRGRPGAHLAEGRSGRNRGRSSRRRSAASPSHDEVLSYLMYPDVFVKFARNATELRRVDVLPTPQFFYGMETRRRNHRRNRAWQGADHQVPDHGRAHPDGTRTVFFELNGQPREVVVRDRKLDARRRRGPRPIPAQPGQIGAPIPGVISTVAVELNQKVNKGDRLLVMEAMKMQSTVYSPVAGTVKQVLVKSGQPVESKDLLLVIE